MKFFKRLLLIAVCAAVVACSFSACSLLGNSGGCKHSEGGNRGADDTSHYLICVTCGGKYNVEKHTTYLQRKDNDNQYHYFTCAWCEHVCETLPHEFTEWRGGTTNCSRNCTVCNFNDKCYHENLEYVVSDTEHYAVCENCEYSFIGRKTEHVYDVYADVTETTHTLNCVCGKSGEQVAHDFTYRYADGEHRQKCECGYEKEKEACTYGDYIISDSGHYKICQKCKTNTAFEKHAFTLTASRERVCDDCEYKQHPFGILIGTWEYTVTGGFAHRLTLLSNWSYKISDSGGNVISSGDYFISEYDADSNGNVTGFIILSRDESITFKFKDGQTNSFNYGYKTYTKV